METPELIELRKKKIEEAMDGSETPQLFTVLPEKRMPTVGGAMMGSTHIYDMATVMSRKGPVPEIQGVEVALAPEELELDPMAMTQKYEEHVREQQAQVEKEDFSDMVAEHAAKQKVRGGGAFNPSNWSDTLRSKQRGKDPTIFVNRGKKQQ
ncbi:splicing factor 3B subunit 2-like, partial [Notechis scutatus]|uniref:Splicing factor 3B subunit 2-like n=1 Tax=Notechis scutatus TaxID=8663 RepID=A0A6J1WA88_9SAUR